MARYKFVKGLPVIAIAEGKQVGKVDDLVIDLERRAVSWLRLHNGGIGILGGKRLWVPVEAVHRVGEDAITINSEADARTPADAPEARTLVKAKRGIIGNKVITENGESLGEVHDYEFNPATFALTSLFVPRGMNAVDGVLPIVSDKVLTIGDDVIIVAATVMGPAVMGLEVMTDIRKDAHEPAVPWVGLLIVGLASALVMLLLAPQSSGEIWTRLQRQSHQLRKQMAETVAGTVELARIKARQVRHAIGKQAKELE